MRINILHILHDNITTRAGHKPRAKRQLLDDNYYYNCKVLDCSALLHAPRSLTTGM